jgi:SAM-dependent methyltransferase
MSEEKTIRFDDVADLYDAYVKVDFDIDFFMNEARSIGGRALELTCGTGRVSLPLLQAGIDLTCVDYSEKMIEVFRKKLKHHRLSGNLIRMDMTRLELRDTYDLIFIPFHSFSEIVDTSKHLPTLSGIYDHLSERGRFICTLQNPAAVLKSISGDLKSIGKFPMDSGYWLEVKIFFRYDRSGQAVSGYQLYEITNKAGKIIEKRKLDITFLLINHDMFKQLISAAGFIVDALYGDYRYTPFNADSSPYHIWKLKKSSPGR